MIGNEAEILLVEDNPNDVELALHAFRKNRLTNPVHTAADGAQALEYVFSDGVAGRLGVILLDLKLPRVDGLDVLRALKGDTRTRHIPVVVMTSSRQESDVVESYGLGVNSYIAKPVDFDNFTEAIRLIGMYWLLLNEPPRGTGGG